MSIDYLIPPLKLNSKQKTIVQASSKLNFNDFIILILQALFTGSAVRIPIQSLPAVILYLKVLWLKGYALISLGKSLQPQADCCFLKQILSSTALSDMGEKVLEEILITGQYYQATKTSTLSQAISTIFKLLRICYTLSNIWLRL